MSIQKFLLVYYGIAYDITKNMKHEDLDILFDNITRTSFEHAEKNSELVSQGKIIYVYDKTGRSFPYITPEAIYICDESEDTFQEEVIKEKLSNELIDIDYDACSLYELKQLLVKYKRILSISNKIRKEIKFRNGQKRPIKRKEIVYD